MLIINGALNHPEQNYYYAILIIIASICYATNVNLIKKYLSDLSPLSITTGNFLVLLFPALLVLVASDFFDVIAVESVQRYSAQSSPRHCDHGDGQRLFGALGS